MGPKAKNMPVFFAKEKLARGEIKMEDIPYMQRGGSWDNSDVKGAKKIKWAAYDKQYDTDGAQKNAGIFGMFNKPKKQEDLRSMSEQQLNKKLGAVDRIRNAPKLPDPAP